MKLNSKGQVTIPARLRAKYNLHEGDEVEVVDDDGALRIIRVVGAPSKGQRLVEHLRHRGSARDTDGMTTDELMELLRGD